MMFVDASTVMVLLLAASLAGAIAGVLPAWRRIMGGDLPVRKLRLRHGQGSTRAEEMRCALCPVLAQCTRRLASGETEPMDNCPNRAFLPGRV